MKNPVCIEFETFGLKSRQLLLSTFYSLIRFLVILIYLLKNSGLHSRVLKVKNFCKNSEYLTCTYYLCTHLHIFV